jgi:hypothetical protein
MFKAPFAPILDAFGAARASKSGPTRQARAAAKISAFALFFRPFSCGDRERGRERKGERKTGERVREKNRREREREGEREGKRGRESV